MCFKTILTFFLFLLLSNAFAYVSEGEEKRFGLTFKQYNTPYKEYQSTKLILPYIKYKKEYWDIEGLRARAMFFNKERFQTGFQGSFEPIGYAGAEQGVTTELTATNYSVPIGIYHYQKFKYFNLNFEFLSSMLGGAGGIIIRSHVAKDYYLFRELIYRPYIGIEYLSATYTNYYYGVEEETASLPIYEPTAALNYVVGQNLTMQSSKNTFVDISLVYRKYHGAIAESPIVSRSSTLDWDVSLSYQF